MWTKASSFICYLGVTHHVLAWTMPHPFRGGGGGSIVPQSVTTPFATLGDATAETSSSSAQQGKVDDDADDNNMFEAFVDFLVQKQTDIIDELEDYEQGSATFSRDAWGVFDAATDQQSPRGKSGGLTRVIQGGNIIEKGACSLTVIRKGVLSADRAATIRARQDNDISIQEGDEYAAAALSMVLHSRSPHVPTFRSDVRVFCVKTSSGDNAQQLAWFGGGADLTPYFLYDDDIKFFHAKYRDLCQAQGNDEIFSYPTMKKACDDYFYLPARSEHRGTGGIFFDDMVMNEQSLAFVQGVTDTWMPSWLPIVQKRNDIPATDQQRQWQLLRRGRYLEFNLLYDRGVKFGLANANPRVEGVMVSAPPLIAFEYNHKVETGSEEDRLLQILKKPIDWV